MKFFLFTWEFDATHSEYFTSQQSLVFFSSCVLLNQGNPLLHEIFDFVPQAEKRKTLSTKEKVLKLH